jgi:hypothetical protein
MLLFTGGDHWVVEKNLLTFCPGNFVRLPDLGEIPLVPIEADTLRN